MVAAGFKRKDDTGSFKPHVFERAALVCNLALGACLLFIVLAAARSEIRLAPWLSTAFHPLVLAISATGLLSLYMQARRRGALLARSLLVLFEIATLYLIFAAIGRSAVSTCQAQAYPRDEHNIVLTVDTFNLDGRVRCHWTGLTESTEAETRRFTMLETLRDRLP